jgi:hypothetical protein
VTHSRASHQPSGASDGRPIPARALPPGSLTSCSRRNDGPGGGSRSGTPAGYRQRPGPVTGQELAGSSPSGSRDAPVSVGAVRSAGAVW